MTPIPDRVEIEGAPDYVGAWSAAAIPGFVPTVLRRWQREYGRLPDPLFVTLCPQVELNASGGLPGVAVELSDARLRCRQFTGCHKPYFVMFFTGADAADHQARAGEALAWSESYRLEIGPDRLRLEFRGATEALAEDEEVRRPRTIASLLESGELLEVLA
ncbi:MAG: hypothetical protein PVF91_05865 [Chromatiales bacterium]|jgi:hypothetical protein